MTEEPAQESLHTQQQDPPTTRPWPEALKQYLQQNKIPFRDFTHMCSIPETSLRHWMKDWGKTALYKARHPEAFQKLYEATHIEELKPHYLSPANPHTQQKVEPPTTPIPQTNDPLQRMDAKLDRILSEISTLQHAPIPPAPSLPSPTEPLVKETKKQFYTLLEKLEQFKHASLENAREQLMQSIPARDVGYTTALLNALYQPNNKFRAFLLSSAYTPGGRP